MKKVVGIAVGFIVVYVFFLISSAPASLISQFISLPNNVLMNNITGTIWQANIERVEMQTVNVHEVDIDLSPMSVLMLSPQVSVRFGGGLYDGPTGDANISISEQDLVIHHAHVELPAQQIVPYLKTPVPVEAFGLVQLDITTLSYSNGQCQNAEGRIAWQRGALSALGENIELGQFDGVISCQDNVLTVEILPKNTLGLSFTAQLNLQGRLSGQGFVKPAANFPAKLKDALVFLGKPDREGRYRIRL